MTHSYQGLTGGLAEGDRDRGRRSGGSSSPHASGCPAPPAPGSREASTGAGGEKPRSPQTERRAGRGGGCTHRLRGAVRTSPGRGGGRAERRRAGRSPDDGRRRAGGRSGASRRAGAPPAPNSCALRPATTHGGRLKRQALRQAGLVWFAPCGERRPVTAPPHPGGTVAFVPGPLGRA